MNSQRDSGKAYASSEFILYAHRGSTVLAPENTLPAFEIALGYGADIMEIDVRLSRDGEIIVIHDEYVDRTCDAQGRVIDMPLTRLKQLDAGYHFIDLEGRSYRKTGTRLLTLSEMFELLPHTPINIDIKDNSEQAAMAVAKVIENSDRVNSVNVGSFHSSALAHFRKRLPEVTTAATQSEVAQLYFKRGLYKKIGFEFLQIPMHYMGIPLATRSFVQHASHRGIKTVYWTVNDEKNMQQLINLNVTGLVTDRVDIAGPLLGKTDRNANVSGMT
ncbi:MAG: glycerophosphodiester phosphodiesterase [Granulosicoccus sp.]